MCQARLQNLNLLVCPVQNKKYAKSIPSIHKRRVMYTERDWQEVGPTRVHPQRPKKQRHKSRDRLKMWLSHNVWVWAMYPMPVRPKRLTLNRKPKIEKSPKYASNEALIPKHRCALHPKHFEKHSVDTSRTFFLYDASMVVGYSDTKYHWVKSWGTKLGFAIPQQLRISSKTFINLPIPGVKRVSVKKPPLSPPRGDLGEGLWDKNYGYKLKIQPGAKIGDKVGLDTQTYSNKIVSNHMEPLCYKHVR